jgi:hypothetical protein
MRGAIINVLWGIVLFGNVVFLVLEWRTGRRWSYHRMGWGLFYAVVVIIGLIERAFIVAGIGAVGLVLNAVWARGSWRRGQ